MSSSIPLNVVPEKAGNPEELGRYRRIIICCDGTWNDRETDQPLTNVTRIQSCFALRDERQTNHRYEQLSYYLDGIGAGTTWTGAIHDGSTGSGIERKIREAYRHLCLTYSHEKDEIILIGFPRGAFTVRCLASLIHDVGLLDGAWVNKELPAIFELWKNQTASGMPVSSRNAEPTPIEKHCQDLIAKYEGTNKGGKETILRRGIMIKAYAVWDTVESLGTPLPRPLPRRDKKHFAFVNYRVTPNIENAFQALSLDERRWHFPPVIWSKSYKYQALKQCWFLGAHSDIGGGFSDPGFANISLCWMISQLQNLVKFNEGAIWNSTEEGRILYVDFVKKKGEGRKGNRDRTMGKAEVQRSSERPQSTPPAGGAHHGDRQPSSISRWISLSRSTVSKTSAGGSSSTPTHAAADTTLAGATVINTATKEDGQDMYGPGLLVAQEATSAFTSYEHSLNPEAIVTAGQGDAETDVATTPEADPAKYPARRDASEVFIRALGRRSWVGPWAVAGWEIRRLGVYRKHGDNSRDTEGRPTFSAQEEDLGSNETIHFSVRVLTDLHPLKGWSQCKALEKFKLVDFGRNHCVWRSSDPQIMDVPQDHAAEYEQEAIAGAQLGASPPTEGASEAQSVSNLALGASLDYPTIAPLHPSVPAPVPGPTPQWLSVPLER